MQVKQRLRINAIISLITALLVLSVSSLALYRLSMANEKAKTAGDIIIGTLERLAFRNDYLRNDNERAKTQWFAKHDEIGRRLKTASEEFREPEDQKTIGELLTIHESTGKLFSAIVANREKSGQVQESNAIFSEVEDRLLSQLNMRIYDVVIDAHKLQMSSREARTVAVRQGVFSIAFMLAIVISAAFLNARSMNRSISDRVKRLLNGAEIIGKGNLDHRVDIRGDDEFAEFAAAFNEMTAKLHSSYQQLYHEVEIRTKAEEKLQTYNTELADSRRAAINLLEDALTARRLAEEAAAALRAREADLSEAQRQAHIGSWHWDAKTDVTTGSDELLRIYGFDPATQTMPDFREQRGCCYPVEEWERINVAVQKTIETGGGYELDVCAYRDGETIWVTTRGEAVCDANGRIKGLRGTVQDITERKRAENALRLFNEQLEQRVAERTAELAEAGEKVRAERQRFLDMLDTLPVIVDIIRADHRIEWANRAYRQALGDNTGQLCYLSQFGYDTPCKECQAFVPLQTGQPHHWEWTLPNGRTFDIYNFPFAAVDGSPAVLEMDIDITEIRQAEAVLRDVNATLEQRVAERTAELQHEVEVRRQAETALAKAHEQTEADRRRLEAILETSPVGVVLVEVADSTLSLVNRRAAEIYGTDYDGLDFATHHAKVNALLPDGTPFPVEQLPVSRAFRGEQVHNVELTIDRPDGIRVPLEINAVPLRNAAGNVTTAVVIFDDITERKRAEQAMRESEEQFRSLADSIPNLAWWANADGYITWYNQRWYDYTGTTPEQMEGWGWQSVHDPKVLPQVMERWKESISTGNPFDMVFPLRGADGIFRPFLTRVMPVFDQHGRIVRWFGTNTDISEQKRIEEALQKAHLELADQMEERVRELREKEVLLKEVHHRVKNNLQVISSLVSMQADGSRDETVRDVLSDVIYRVRSMALVHEKLYHSESLARIDFAEYAKSLLGYLWRAHGAAAEAVRLTCDLEPVELPVDIATPCGLILNELAGNCLKHAFRGRSEGEVAVSLHRNDEGRVYLSVRDNGVGLPKEFDWRQANSLGLRLVQMLAAQLGAEVEVRRNGGTEFTISFRLKTEG